MIFKDFLKNILIIVVIYKNKISECESIITISDVLNDYTIDLFIYDNSPEYNLNEFKHINNFRIIYFADNENSGVSRAYNLGADKAKSLNKHWLILCDQDTVFERKYFEDIYSAVETNNPSLIAPFLFSNSKLISPCGFIFNFGYALKKQPICGWNNLEKTALLNSGLFISLDAFYKCDGYNENVFLDFADFDFLKRYKKKYPNYYLINTSLVHQLESSVRGSFNVARFVKYCQSYRCAIHSIFDFATISLIVFFRTIKLSAYFSSCYPIKAFFLYFVFGK